MRLVLGLLGLLVGCFFKPDAPVARDGGTGSDGSDGSVSSHDSAIDAPLRLDCTNAGPFVYLRTHGEFSSDILAEPTMTADELEVFYTSDPNNDSHYQIHRGSRASVVDVFTLDPAAPPFNDPGFYNQDASITGDGLMIAFASNRTESDGRAYYSTRADRTALWATPLIMPGLQDVAVFSLDLSDDGLELYYADQSGNLRRATRTVASAPFVPEMVDLGSGRVYPSVSADGLELYYNNTGATAAIRRATRLSETVGFPTGPNTVLDCYDADLLPDGQTLVANAASGAGIMVFRRTCPLAPP